MRARADSAHAEATKVSRQDAATVCEIWLCQTRRQCVEGAAHQPVARRINGVLLETTGDLAAKEQHFGFGLQKIDAAAHPRQYGFNALVAAAEIAPEAAFDGETEQPGDQVRQIGGLFNLRVETVAEARQIRCVEQQEPEIAHRYAAARHWPCRIDEGCRLRHHSGSPVNRRLRACSALSGASYQYSSSNGPISVSTTCRNHFPPSAPGAPSGGVT